MGQHGKGGGSVLTSPLCPHCACTSLWGDPICRRLLEGRWPTAQNYQRTMGKAVRKRPIGQCGYNNHNVLINALIFCNFLCVRNYILTVKDPCLVLPKRQQRIAVIKFRFIHMDSQRGTWGVVVEDSSFCIEPWEPTCR